MLCELIEKSTKYDDAKHDHTAPASTIGFDPNARMRLQSTLFGDMPPLEPTDWAWGQIFSKLGPAVYGKGTSRVLPRDYLMAIPPYLLAINLNDHIKGLNGKDWLIRGYEDRARAVLSAGYAVVQNTELLEFVDEIIQSDTRLANGIRIVRPHVNADDINVQILWRDINRGGPPGPGGGGNYAVGTYIGNGEIGNRSVRIWPSIQRHSCDNSIHLKSDSGITLMHRGSARAIMTQVKAAMVQTLPVSAELVDKLIEAEYERIDDFSSVLDGLAIQHGWDDTTKSNVYLGTENNQTRAGIVNGVSYAAHASGLDGNDSADMSALAGAILVAPDSLFGAMAKKAHAEAAK